MKERGGEISGSCLCGAVRYSAPPPTLFCAHCHCDYCRRAHGAAFVTWFGLREESCRVASEDDMLRWYVSSQQSRRGFCGRCGTTLFFASELCPGEIHVALATATTPIDRQPELHCFHDQRVAWVRVDDGLPVYESGADALKRYRAVKPLCG